LTGSFAGSVVAGPVLAGSVVVVDVFGASVVAVADGVVAGSAAGLVVSPAGVVAAGASSALTAETVVRSAATRTDSTIAAMNFMARLLEGARQGASGTILYPAQAAEAAKIPPQV
jgi:hypothetical protein